MARLRVAALLLWGSSALAHAPAQSPAGPVFEAGDPAVLTCRVVAQKPGEDGKLLLTVEVHNRGPVAAEPLVFELEQPQGKGQPPRVETFARAQLPHAARHGRPAPAGGKQSYLVPVVAAKKGTWSARVTAASFGRDLAVAEPAFRFGKPEQVQRTSLAGTFPVTQVAIGNPLACDVDVLMQVTFQQPKDCVELVGVRLPAGSTLAVVIATRPGREVFLDPLMESPGCAIRATAFDVVDWCLCGTAAADAGSTLLRDAYEAWYRWPGAPGAVAGDFAYRVRQKQAGNADGYDDLVVRGRFTLSADGDVDVEILDGKGANASFLLREALSHVRRPDFAELTAQNRLLPVAANRVAVIGPGWHLIRSGHGGHRTGGVDKSEEHPDLEVRDGRIVSDGMGTTSRSAWESQVLHGALVVTRRASADRDLRFHYAMVDGRIVPSAASEVVTAGGKLFQAGELELGNWKFGDVTPIAARVPTGAGVEALRAIWDSAYRLPTGPIEVTAKFDVATGNDGVWRGRKKFGGRITMHGIGRSLRASDIRLDGTFARDDEVQLGAMLRDRLLMWFGVDFNDRQPFDEQFAGATIHAADGDGVFPVDGGAWDRVLTSGGKVRGMRGRGGSSMLRYTYGKVGAREVVVRIDIDYGGERTPAAQRWSAATVLTMVAVGDHVLPGKIVFERAFGRDWEPETITFRELAVRQ